jgi:probable addiction module antidote protein
MSANEFPKSVPFDNDAMLLEMIRIPENAAAFLVDMVSEGDDDLTKQALMLIAKAQDGGVAAVAEKAGLSRTSLYKALSPSGQPSYSTINKVVKAMGLTISFHAAA